MRRAVDVDIDNRVMDNALTTKEIYIYITFAKGAKQQVKTTKVESCVLERHKVCVSSEA